MTLISTDPDSALVPTNDEGEPFHCAFVRSDGSAVFADTLTEITAAVIDGYPIAINPDGPTVENDEALIARLDSLAEHAAGAQAIAAADATAAGRKFSEDELTAMFTEKDRAVAIAEWRDEQTPLLLLATSYAPYTATALPAGAAVTILDPSTERTYLEALASITGSELLIQGG